MPRLVAASISMTSTALPARISVQESQMPQGSGVGRSARADLVAAVQRHGQDAGDGGLADAAVAAEDVAVRDAVLRQSAFSSVRVTWSWPTTSAKRCGRYLRARTW